MAREVVVVSGVRTAIGTFGGSLKDIPPSELAAQVVQEVLQRASVRGEEVGQVVFGHVVNTEPRDMYLSRIAAIQGGCAESTIAFNVNRLCGSGLQAIVNASQSILLGDTDIAIGGGAENMSRAPYASLNMRWGARMGDTSMVDMMTAPCTTRSTPSTWASPPKTLPSAGVSAGRNRTRWPSKATTVRNTRQRAAISHPRYCRSRSKAKRGPPRLRSTNTSGPTARWPT